MLKNCPVCSSEFEADKVSQKYCSKECRLINLRESDRLRKQKEREEARIIREQAQERERKERKEARQKAEHERLEAIEKEQQALIDKANTGDPLARMKVAKSQSMEYWEAYKDYVIEHAESNGNISKKIVNEISVYEHDFSRKVIASIKELGYIRTDIT